MGGTALQLGQWNTITDTFVAASSSPTGAVIDLNDGVTWTLLDESEGLGSGLDWGEARPAVYKSSNVRTIGERVTRRVYQNNRQVVIHLFWGQGTSYATWITAIHNLVATLEGISQSQPATLKVQVAGASSAVFLDVVEGHCLTAYKELEWLQLVDDGVVVEFEARPFFRGPRQTLQNLVMNPGFEAPFGGGVATTPPTAFSDTFANVNAYTVVAGAAPTLSPANTYVDIVHADSPARHYRLGESSGTSAYDIGGGFYTGTTHGGPTQGVAGGISGDTDTCYTFASASSQYVSCPVTGLPTGNGAITLEAWCKFAANPASSATLVGYGSNTNGTALNLFITTAGKASTEFWGGIGTVTSAAALTTGVWHHVVATWNGTTLTLYVDGASTGTPTTPGSQSLSNTNLSIGVNSALNSAFFNGQLDEVCVYGAALSSTQVSNHYTAGHSGATGTVSNAMSIPAAGQVSFGSPAWGAVQTWQVRWRNLSTLTNASFYLHRTDANNYIRAWVNQTTLNLEQCVAGVTHTLTTAVTIALVHEAWYWLQFTQFPASVSPNVPYVQALLLSDNEGAVGAQIASTAGATNDAVTAMTGVASLQAAGASLVIGGNYTNSHALMTFGPGAWSFASSGTGVASGAWDGAPAGGTTPTSVATNCYSGGPFTSYGCARLDAAPTGTLNAQWQSATALVAANIQQSGIPISAAGNVLGISSWVKSSGVGAGCAQAIKINEYDTNGNFLRSNAVSGATVSGAQAVWTQLSGTYTTGASCAFVVVLLTAVDGTAGSANGTVWWDNVLVYNQTTTGQTSMAYHEMRAANSPAQLQVSGIKGDVPSPGLLQLGMYASTFDGGPLTMTLGRKQWAHKDARFVAPPQFISGGNLKPVLNAAVWGGYIMQFATNFASGNQIQPTSWIGTSPDSIAALRGTFALYMSYKTAVSTPADVRFNSASGGTSVGVNNAISANSALYITSTVNPLANTSWTMVSLGKLVFYPQGINPTADMAQAYLGPISVSQDTNPSLGSVFSGDQFGAIALVYLDGGVVSLAMSSSSLFINGEWWWYYLDGTSGTNLSGGVSYNFNPSALPQSLYATPMLTTSGFTAATASIADPYITLDPSTLNGTTPINQFSAVLQDSDGVKVTNALAMEIEYTPLYLYPN